MNNDDNPPIGSQNNQFQKETQTAALTQNRKWFIVIGVLILLLILSAVGYFFWFKPLLPDMTKQNQQTIVKAEDKVLQTYKLLEKSIQTGDGNLWLSLHSQKSLDALSIGVKEKYQQESFPPRPYISYPAESVMVRGDQAAVFGKMVNSQDNTSQFYSVRFVFENNDWKIAEESFTNEPVDKNIFLPPKESSFIKAGLPWDNVPYATLNTASFNKEELNWNMQAIMDETFLFIHFTSEVSLPLVGIEIDSAGKQAGEIRTGAPQRPPSLVIDIKKNSTEDKFGLLIGDVIKTKATFDELGKAKSNRFFVDYSFSVDKNNNPIFHKFTDDADQLITADDKYINVRIPIQSLNITDQNSMQLIVIREFNSVARILPYQVQTFAP